MHFNAIAIIKKDDIVKNKFNEERFQRSLELAKEYEGKDFNSRWMHRQLMQTADRSNPRIGNFLQSAEELLWKFCFDNEANAVFEEDSEIEYEYQNDSMLVFRYPNGMISPYLDRNYIMIQDGRLSMVKKRCFGKNHNPKTTKKSKKYKVIPDYPIRKYFTSIREYAKYCGLVENDEKFGNIINPNGYFDWYEIGGRWAHILLAKDDCTEVIKYRAVDEDTEEKAPDGYQWVSIARKKDIQWDAMKNNAIEQATKMFNKFFDMFESKNFDKLLTDFPYLKQCDDTIINRYYGEYRHTVYRHGMTLDEFISSKIPNTKLYLYAHDIIIDGEMHYNIPVDELHKHIEEADDDDLIVMCDYHT